MSFTGGYQSTIGQVSSAAGGVFITDITPQTAAGNVSAKVYSSGGRVLDSCLVSQEEVIVKVLAITGKTHFKPVVWLESIELELQQDEDQNIWTGELALSLEGKTSIKAIHEDGASHQCLILYDTIPEILKAEFIGTYPGTQTELKAGDQFSLQVDASGAFDKIEVDNYGVSEGEQFAFEGATSKTVQIVIADRGSSLASYGVRLRVGNVNGSFSQWYLSSNYGSEDGRHTLNLNNLQPNIVLQEITYPPGQGALKEQETAMLHHSISSFDEVEYTSLKGEVLIADSLVYNSTKSVQRLSGLYNGSENNVRITATRKANAAQFTLDLNIKIAQVAAEVMMLPLEDRLRSGGNLGTEAEEYELRFQSNQELSEGVQLLLPAGQKLGNFELLDEANLIYRQRISIHDNEPKGSFEVGLLTCNNRAGIPTAEFTGSSQYELGGFVARTITMAAFSRIAELGTKVSDTSKLLARDQTERIMQYSEGKENALLSYTITDEEAQLDSEGDHLYWNDAQAANNNSTGLATITIEELT